MRILVACVVVLAGTAAFAQTTTTSSTSTSSTVPTPTFNETNFCGTMQACLTPATGCDSVRVSKLDRKTVHIDETAGTMIVDVECQLTPTDTWVAVPNGTGIAADVLLPIDLHCLNLRILPTTCTSCNYTATLCGVPYGAYR